MASSLPDEIRIQNYLYDLTDYMLDNSVDVPELAARHDIAPHLAEQYATMLSRLDDVLVDVEVSRQFKRELRKELLGEPQPTLLSRFRSLPPRLQFAAALALFTAAALIGRRRLRGEALRLWNQLRVESNEHTPQEAKISAS